MLSARGNSCYTLHEIEWGHSGIAGRRAEITKKMQLDVDIEPTFRFSYMKCIDKQKNVTMIQLSLRWGPYLQTCQWELNMGKINVDNVWIGPWANCPPYMDRTFEIIWTHQEASNTPGVWTDRQMESDA